MPTELWVLVAVLIQGVMMLLAYFAGRTSGYNLGFDECAKIWEEGAEKLNVTWKHNMTKALAELNEQWARVIGVTQKPPEE